VTVTSPVEVGCSPDRPAVVSGLAGFLSNYVPSQSTSDLGPSRTTPCPWRIVVGPGQLINLTLIDFGTPRAVADVRPGCVQYAVVMERVRPPRTIRVCGGHRRRQHLHTSLSNAVDIHVTSGRHDVDEHFYFLLHYKGQLLTNVAGLSTFAYMINFSCIGKALAPVVSTTTSLTASVDVNRLAGGRQSFIT